MSAVSVLMVAVSRCSSLSISQAQVNQGKEQNLQDLTDQAAQNRGRYVQPVPFTAIGVVLILHAHSDTKGKKECAYKAAQNGILKMFLPVAFCNPAHN